MECVEVQETLTETILIIISRSPDMLKTKGKKPVASYPISERTGATIDRDFVELCFNLFFLYSQYAVLGAEESYRVEQLDEPVHLYHRMPCSWSCYEHKEDTMQN
jgi:hypothetical protein